MQSLPPLAQQPISPPAIYIYLLHSRSHYPYTNAKSQPLMMDPRLRQDQPQAQQSQPRSHQVVKTATAVTAGGSLLLLSGLTLAGTVITLALATPLLVIFSPVLVPATIAVCLLASGFLASGGFGIAAVTVLSWLYRYVAGKNPPGAESLDQARMKLASKAREMKDRAEQFGQNVTASQEQHQQHRS